MSEYDDIDALTGGKAIESTPLNKTKMDALDRIKPCLGQTKFQGGNSASKISADPSEWTPYQLII